MRNSYLQNGVDHGDVSIPLKPFLVSTFQPCKIIIKKKGFLEDGDNKLNFKNEDTFKRK